MKAYRSACKYFATLKKTQQLTLTTFEDETNCRIHGVTFPQNSNKIPIVMLCASEVGAEVHDSCSK